MAPAGKVERFWEVTVALRRQVPGLCPLLPFLAHTCAPARTGTGTCGLSPGLLRRSPRSCGGRATAGSKWRSACLAVCVMEGMGKESTCMVAMRTTVARVW